MDVCSLSNGVGIGLLGLPFLLLCGLASLPLLTILAGYNQLFIAVCVCDKSAIADVLSVGVCPVCATFLTVGVAVGAVGVQTGGVAAHDVAVRVLAARVAFRAVGAVPAWRYGGVLEGAVRVCAVGVELAVHLGREVGALLCWRGVRSDALLICAGGAVGTCVSKIESNAGWCGGRLMTEVT